MKYFTIKELTSSSTAKNLGIDNKPNEKQLENIEVLIVNLLDPLREAYGSGIRVSSGFRCEKLNKIVKGSANSDHKTGKAADLIPVDGDTRKLFNLAKKLMDENTLEVGQLIWEYGTKDAPAWVHISLPTQKHQNEILYIGI